MRGLTFMKSALQSLQICSPCCIGPCCHIGRFGPLSNRDRTAKWWLSTIDIGRLYDANAHARRTYGENIGRKVI